MLGPSLRCLVQNIPFSPATSDFPELPCSHLLRIMLLSVFMQGVSVSAGTKDLRVPVDVCLKALAQTLPKLGTNTMSDLVLPD